MTALSKLKVISSTTSMANSHRFPRPPCMIIHAPSSTVSRPETQKKRKGPFALDMVGTISNGTLACYHESTTKEATMVFVLIAILVIILLTGLFTVRQQTAAIVERFGRFTKISPAGLNFKIPLVDKIAGRVSLR